MMLKLLIMVCWKKNRKNFKNIYTFLSFIESLRIAPTNPDMSEYASVSSLPSLPSNCKLFLFFFFVKNNFFYRFYQDEAFNESASSLPTASSVTQSIVSTATTVEYGRVGNVQPPTNCNLFTFYFFHKKTNLFIHFFNYFFVLDSSTNVKPVSNCKFHLYICCCFLLT